MSAEFVPNSLRVRWGMLYLAAYNCDGLLAAMVSDTRPIPAGIPVFERCHDTPASTDL